MLWLCLPMITGCSSGIVGAGDPPSPAVVAAVVDTTAVRCVEASQRQRAIMRRRVKPPMPDTPDGVSRAQLYAKIDELRRDAHEKGETGLAVADQLDRCRRAPAADATPQAGS